MAPVGFSWLDHLGPASVPSDQPFIMRVQSIVHGAEDVTHLERVLGAPGCNETGGFTGICWV